VGGVDSWDSPVTKPDSTSHAVSELQPWNKGRLVGQKRPLRPKDVWAIRIRLELRGCSRDLALFNLAIDSKLRACDLVALKTSDVHAGDRMRERTQIVQKKTERPVQFEITETTRISLATWIKEIGAGKSVYLFSSGRLSERHLSTRQYSRLVHQWIESAGFDKSAYGTHSMRRTKAAHLYAKPAIFARFNFFLVIPSLRVPCVTWGSKRKTRWPFLNRSKSDSNCARASQHPGRFCARSGLLYLRQTHSRLKTV